MIDSNKRKLFNRITIYVAGMMILALGITLNTKTALGVSPLISMPFSVSEITSLNFAALAFVMYALFTCIEIFLEGDRRKKSEWLQIPYSLLFSLLLQLFSSAYDAAGIELNGFLPRFILLLVAVALTGIGVSMSVSMNLIPNPADGLAREVGIKLRHGLGLGKNAIDVTSVAITCAIGLLTLHRIVGVGIGTVVAMIGVGRSIAAFNHFALKPMRRAAGLENNLNS